MLSPLLPVLLLTSSLQQPSEGVPLPPGVTILESGDLQTRLADADRFLKQQDSRIGVATLQGVLEGDPAALIRASPDDLLFWGAVHQARQRVLNLNEHDAALRKTMFEKSARDAFLQASSPISPSALRTVEAQFLGTKSGQQASLLRREWLLDRGLLQRAQSTDEIGGWIPESWISSWQLPGPRSAFEHSTASSLQDPGLAQVHSQSLRELWRYSFEDPPFGGTYFGNHRAATGLGSVFLTDSKEVVALDQGTGQILWRFDGPPGWQEIPSNTTTGKRQRQRLTEAFDTESLFAPVLEDGVLLVVLQEPLLLGRSEAFFDIDIRRYLPGRRLYAFDARTGDILWKQNINWETPNGQKDPRDLAAGPPAAAKGRVFLPVYSASGTIDLSLLAFDLHTGASLWRTFLVSGSLESNLFGNVLTELASAPPWTDGNSVVLCTNLGAICSLDSTYGFVRWTRLYEKSAIRTYQTGDLSRREPGFVNQAPTCDGDKFFCAPSDSRWALALRVQDGEQLHQWPSRPQGSGGPAFDWLSGLLGNAVLLSGTHLQLQPLEQGKPPILTSPLLHNRYSSAATRRPAILARGEILMPTPEGIQSLDPRTGASLRPPLPWPQGMNDFGALQAIPGGVLVFRQGGVIALGSTAGLLATLPSEPDLALLRSALPLLESLDKGMDPSQAAEIARRCEALAQNCTDPHVAQRLTLVAVRAWNSAHKFERGLPHLSSLLNSEFPDLAETSALWVLRPESFSFIPQKITMEALDVFTNNRNSAPGPEVALPDSTKRVLLIAQIRIAEKHPDKDALRSHLLHAVLWNAEQQTGPLAEESIQDWASQKLIALVQDPRQARGLEADAQRYLEEASPSAAVLRAFGTTDIIQSWLEERSHDESLARADEIALLALLRDHSKGPLDRLQSAKSWFQPRTLPQLLEQGELLAEGNIGKADVLAAAPHGLGGARLLLQRSDAIVLATFSNKGLVEHAIWNPHLSGLKLPSLQGTSFLEPEGAVVVWKNRWVHLKLDGTVEEILLPGRADGLCMPVRQGSFLAIACIQDGKALLQLRDLQSGAVFWERRLPEPPGDWLQLVFQDTHLWAFRHGEKTCWKTNFLANQPWQTIELKHTPSALDLQSTVVAPQGVLSPKTGGIRPSVHLHDPLGGQAWQASRHSLVKTFRLADLVGWVLQPLVPGRGEQPNPIIHWLPPHTANMVQKKELEGGSRRFVPQFHALQGRALTLRKPEILSYTERNGNVVVEFLPLTPTATHGPSVELPDTPFTRIVVRRLLAPLPAQDGWLVPLVLGTGPRELPELRLFSITSQGTLGTTLPQLRVPQRTRDLSIHLLEKALLVRTGEQLQLFGSP